MIKEKINFIQFLIDCNVLEFGNFVTKSGRKSPYFINTGNFKTGKQIKIIGEFYAEKIKNIGCSFNAIFGPAYKGIPLAISCCEAMFEKFGLNIPFFFDRKEAKDHGEGGFFIGYKPSLNESVIIIEDVLTAGTEINKIVPILKEQFKIKISHLFIAVNRCEKIKNSDQLAKDYLREKFNIEVHSIVDIFDIENFIKDNKAFRKHLEKMSNYIEIYCSK